MSYQIETRDLPEQKLLSVTRRVPQSEIAKTIGETLPLIFVYAQKNGIAIAGLPLTRYPDMNPGLVTLEPAMRIVDASSASGSKEAEAEVQLTSLPAGPAVMTLHAGPYDTLHQAYAALQKWMEAEGRVAAGPPWEEYLTDPGEHPNPEDWRTEVYWPLKA